MTGHRRSARACDESGDVGRAAVYACELAAFDGTDLEDRRSFEEVERIIRSIAHDPWWTGPVVSVRRARAGTASSVAAGSVGRTEAPVEVRLGRGPMHVCDGSARTRPRPRRRGAWARRRVPPGLPRRRGDGIQPRPARPPRHHPRRPTGRSLRLGRPDAGRASMATSGRRHRGRHRAVAANHWSVPLLASVGCGSVVRDVAQLG